MPGRPDTGEVGPGAPPADPTAFVPPAGPTHDPGTYRGRWSAAAESRGIPLATIVTTLLVGFALLDLNALLILLLWVLRTIILYTLVAFFIAILLSPAVHLFQRRGMSRGLAVTIVFVVALVVFLGHGGGVHRAPGVGHHPPGRPAADAGQAGRARARSDRAPPQALPPPAVGRQERPQDRPRHHQEPETGPGPVGRDRRRLHRGGPEHHRRAVALRPPGGPEDPPRAPRPAEPGPGRTGVRACTTRPPGRSPGTCWATASPR